MLRNTQSQSVAGYTGNLSDQAKKRTEVYQTSPQYQTAVQPGMASPSSNLPSPSIPGTVNVAGTPTQIPTQPSGKSGGFNRWPATPQPGITTPGIKQQPGISPAPGYPRDEHGHPDMGEKTRWYRRTPGGGFEYGHGAAMPEGEGWNKDIMVGLTDGGQRMGKPMTLRDAYSTLSSAGYGSF